MARHARGQLPARRRLSGEQERHATGQRELELPSPSTSVMPHETVNR